MALPRLPREGCVRCARPAREMLFSRWRAPEPTPAGCGLVCRLARLRGLCRPDCGLPVRAAFWPKVLLSVSINSWLWVLLWTRNPGLQLFIIAKNYFWARLGLLGVSRGPSVI